MNVSDSKNPVPSYRLYRERSGESGDFWIHCETIPERTHLHNWEIAAHRHDAFFQIFLLTAGHGDLVGNGSGRTFAAPAALFIPPRAVHGFTFSRDVDGLVLTALADRLASIAATDRRIAAFVGETRIVVLSRADSNAEAVTAGIARIHREIAGRGPGRAVLLEALTTDVLVSLSRTGFVGGCDADGSDSRDRIRLERLETLIGAHFREHRSVAFYAGRIGVSPAHLNRFARAQTGASVQKLIARHVLEAARLDLIFTPSPVQAIAYGLGYQDPAYFNRFFRKQTGQTPGAFRDTERARLNR